MSKKIGLALGSGGARGVCHIGVLKALTEAGIQPDYICGSSMGAVVGACFAKGMSVDDMLAAVKKLSAVKLMDLSAVPISRLALFQGNKMHKLLLSNIGRITFDDLKIPFGCVATDLYSGRTVLLTKGDLTAAVRASSSIPAMFPPVKLDGANLVDGGVLCRVPTQEVKSMGADVVIAVDALMNTGESVDNVKNIFSLITRVFDIMDYNQQQLKKQVYGHKHEVWIEPEMHGLSQYTPKDFDVAFEAGYKAAKARMSAIKRLVKGSHEETRE